MSEALVLVGIRVRGVEVILRGGATSGLCLSLFVLCAPGLPRGVESSQLNL